MISPVFGIGESEEVTEHTIPTDDKICKIIAKGWGKRDVRRLVLYNRNDTKILYKDYD